MQILVVGSENMCVMQPKVISGSTKVVNFGTDRNRIFDFLLVINSNLCHISHRFGDTVAYWSKIANSYPPRPHSTPSLGVTPFEFWDERDKSRTRMMGLPYGEEIVVVGRTLWSQSTSVTDRRTGGQTDRITIASHGKNGLLCTPLCKCYDRHCANTLRENIRESD